MDEEKSDRESGARAALPASSRRRQRRAEEPLPAEDVEGQRAVRMAQEKQQSMVEAGFSASSWRPSAYRISDSLYFIMVSPAVQTLTDQVNILTQSIIPLAAQLSDVPIDTFIAGFDRWRLCAFDSHSSDSVRYIRLVIPNYAQEDEEDFPDSTVFVAVFKAPDTIARAMCQSYDDYTAIEMDTQSPKRGRSRMKQPRALGEPDVCRDVLCSLRTATVLKMLGAFVFVQPEEDEVLDEEGHQEEGVEEEGGGGEEEMELNE